ncbi:MAG: hypothetical protein HYX75_15350 [Acidobacteria bacterium]|nr:hypothetical protein [Acidobacteriota bacterium]
MDVSTTDPSLTLLLQGIARLGGDVWLKDVILSALADANTAASVESMYRHYSLRLVDALDDPDDAELADFLFTRMLESEGVVNALVQEQRDHLRHTIHDFLLGYFILNSTSYFQPLGADLARRTGHDGDAMVFLNRVWFLAAHFHDIGYPIQFHHFSLSFARQVVQDFPYVDTSVPGMTMTYGKDAPLAPLFAWRAGLYATDEERRRKVPILSSDALRRQLDQPDHALTAAFLLWDRANEADLSAPSERSFTGAVLRTAALACASHNFQYLVSSKDEWFGISLRHDPVSFLLHLVDEAQEWSRERIDASLLWEKGEPKHKYSDVSLIGTPSVCLGPSADLEIRYGVALTPLLDPIVREYQLERAREMLERDLIRRNRRLAGVLRIDRMPDIRWEARYHLIAPSPAPRRDLECTVRLQVGKHDPEWVCRFLSVHRSKEVSFEPAGAVVVENRERGARVFIGADGVLTPQSCQLGETLLRVTAAGLVTDCNLRRGTVYLLVGAGGVGKSTLLRNLAANAPRSWSAFHIEFIPRDARELDLSTRKSPEKSGRLFLVDHFDHTLAQRNAEYWKEELSRVKVPDDAVLVLACRSEVADDWPYLETRPDIQVVEAFREGHFSIQPEQFVQERLRMLRPSVREELSQFAYRTKGERWIPATEAPPGLLDRAGPEMIRPVQDRVRFDHDYLQDALSALTILREIAGGHSEFELGPVLIEQPPWVYVFLIWSLCGEKRGVSPFLDVANEAYLRIRRSTLDALLRSYRALQWLQHTGAFDRSAQGVSRIQPHAELYETVSRAQAAVRPEHLGMAAYLASHSINYLGYFLPPVNENHAEEQLRFALRFHEDGSRIDHYFTAAHAIPAKWWFMRRHNRIMMYADYYTREYERVHALAKCIDGWEACWDEELTWIESAAVDEATKDYWLAVWMIQRFHGEFYRQWRDSEVLTTDRTAFIEHFRCGLEFVKKGLFHRRRAVEACRRMIEEGAPPPLDGYATMAQALGDCANGHGRAIQGCWRVISGLGGDPFGSITQMTVRSAHEIQYLWQRARRSLRPGEVLSRFYASCSPAIAYAATVRAFRENPERQFHEIIAAAQAAINDWLKPYPFEAARDPVFEGPNLRAQINEVIGIVAKLGNYLRKEAREWTGGKEGN